MFVYTIIKGFSSNEIANDTQIRVGREGSVSNPFSQKCHKHAYQKIPSNWYKRPTNALLEGGITSYLDWRQTMKSSQI